MYAYLSASPFIPSLRPSCGNKTVTPLVHMTAAPPGSRYAPHFPEKGRFQAPEIRLHKTEMELVNTVSLRMSEVPLDETHAAELMRNIRASTNLQKVLKSGSFGQIFDTKPINTSLGIDEKSLPQDKYFPVERRNEVPLISVDYSSDRTPELTLGVTTLDCALSGEALEEDVQLGQREVQVDAFWKRKGTAGVIDRSRNVNTVVQSNFGMQYRNKAPVVRIDFDSLSVQLESITGEPEKMREMENVYPKEKRYFAPRIRMKAPKGDWDSSAYLEVASTEVQLPILNAVNIAT